MEYGNAGFVSVFKALADDSRLKIIRMLNTGEMCACKILEEFEITQPTLSYHMKILTESGLVKARRDGAWMRYSLNRANAGVLKGFLDQLFSADQGRAEGETE